MNKKTKKIIWILSLLLVISTAVVGYYLFNKGPVDVRNSGGLKINAAELYNAFIEDSAAAQKKYAGKILLVNGIAAEVSRNKESNLVVSIKTGTEAAYINCTLEENIHNIIAGQQVNIKGICSGIGQSEPELGIKGDVYLTRCFTQP